MAIICWNKALCRAACFSKDIAASLWRRRRALPICLLIFVAAVWGSVWMQKSQETFTKDDKKEKATTVEVVRYDEGHPTLALYSAHERTLDGAMMVTVVGLADRDKVGFIHVTCRLRVEKEKAGTGNDSLYCDTQGNFLVLPEHHSERYGAVLIDCPMLAERPRPNFVSVVVNLTDPYLYSVRITYLEAGEPKRQLALCMPPIHSGYNNWKELVETLEFQQLLGVDRADVYVQNTGPNVTSVLNYYVSSGFLRLHEWPDPPQPVHYFGQLAAVNDCLLRMRNVAKLVMFTDLDEIILPHHHDFLSNMLQDVLKGEKDPDHVGAFNFLNSFFVPSGDSEAQHRLLNSTLDSDQIHLADSLGLKAVSGLYHGKVFPFTERSKCIVDPLTVTMMQVHFVGIFTKGFRSVTVDPSISLLHHYRVREDKESLVLETSALKFSRELIKRVHSVWKAVGFIEHSKS